MVLVSGVQRNDSVCVCTDIYIYILFQIHFPYYKILSIVPCAIQWVLLAYLFNTVVCIY